MTMMWTLMKHCRWWCQATQTLAHHHHWLQVTQLPNAHLPIPIRLLSSTSSSLWRCHPNSHHVSIPLSSGTPMTAQLTRQQVTSSWKLASINQRRTLFSAMRTAQFFLQQSMTMSKCLRTCLLQDLLSLQEPTISCTLLAPSSQPRLTLRSGSSMSTLIPPQA